MDVLALTLMAVSAVAIAALTGWVIGQRSGQVRAARANDSALYHAARADALTDTLAELATGNEDVDLARTILDGVADVAKSLYPPAPEPLPVDPQTDEDPVIMYDDPRGDFDDVDVMVSRAVSAEDRIARAGISQPEDLGELFDE